jgi:hypothetical protein
MYKRNRTLNLLPFEYLKKLIVYCLYGKDVVGKKGAILSVNAKVHLSFKRAIPSLSFFVFPNSFLSIIGGFHDKTPLWDNQRPYLPNGIPS